MDSVDFFYDHGLLSTDLLHFINILRKFDQLYGSDQCWCLKTVNKSIIKNFSTSHNSKPLFKGEDARLLALAIVDQYQEEDKPVVVRKGQCSSIYCINPTHYYFGSRKDVAFERNMRTGNAISPELVQELRAQCKNNRSYSSIARQYNIPYNTVRRICTYESYE